MLGAFLYGTATMSFMRGRHGVTVRAARRLFALDAPYRNDAHLNLILGSSLLARGNRDAAGRAFRRGYNRWRRGALQGAPRWTETYKQCLEQYAALQEELGEVLGAQEIRRDISRLRKDT